MKFHVRTGKRDDIYTVMIFDENETCVEAMNGIESHLFVGNRLFDSLPPDKALLVRDCMAAAGVIDAARAIAAEV